MSIILEGPDGAGKSTLAAILAEELNLDILRMTENGPKRIEEYRKRIKLKRCVIDRCWISEMLYSRVFERNSRVCWGDGLDLLRSCGDNDVTVVFVLPPLDRIKENLEKRGDEHLDEILPKLGELREAYERFAKDHKEIIIVERSDLGALDDICRKCVKRSV